MTVGSHNFVKFTVIKPHCQKNSHCVFASGKNAMYPATTKVILFKTNVLHHYYNEDTKEFHQSRKCSIFKISNIN